jgi:hypothetical protein
VTTESKEVLRGLALGSLLALVIGIIGLVLGGFPLEQLLPWE